MSIQYSASDPATFSFADGMKQAVANIEDVPGYEEKKYYNISEFPKEKIPLYATIKTWVPPLLKIYINVQSKAE